MVNEHLIILVSSPAGVSAAQLVRLLTQHLPEVELLVADEQGAPYVDEESTFVFKAPPAFDDPNVRATDFDDTYRGKCKRLRREARGW